MKVGFLQVAPAFGRKKDNLERVGSLLKNAKADLIVLPELFNTGYTFLSKKELTLLAEPAETGETFAYMRELSSATGCCYAYGFAERDGDTFFNSAALVGPHGLIGIYRKNHLFFEEKLYFTPGNLGFPVFSCSGVNVGILVCYDWIYPEAMRTLALNGAQIIAHCANLVMSYCPDAHKTRALENGVFIVMANRSGEEHRDGKSHTFIGSSEIVTPRGAILFRANDDTCLHVCTINPEEALDKKMNEYNDLMKDRRSDIYFK